MFQGRPYDPETGFYWYRTRYYDPRAGRFTSRDTIGIWGDPLNLGNGYTFVGNNPWTWLDPYGLQGRPYIDYIPQDVPPMSCRDCHNPYVNGAPFGARLPFPDAETEAKYRFMAERHGISLEQIQATADRWHEDVGEPGLIAVAGVDLATAAALTAYAAPQAAGAAYLYFAYNPQAVPVAVTAAEIIAAPADMPSVCPVASPVKQSVKRVVIGEGMEDIKTVARAKGAKWYQAWSKNFKPENFNLEESLRRNLRWIRTKIREGFEILDIGIDPKRSRRSPFYQIERETLEKAKYPVTPTKRPPE